ncbi:hypothetical protein N8I77_006424 [Diaporthe amygdali]|uniref:Uncharacterized protein n=1 Tax=Phomopsis amygdali TaxID=1214568 RepID=A0AAD9SGZ7_PHOAM|nr:hypothetical protein N8I77_006424 [Diaporthe amygdali]
MSSTPSSVRSDTRGTRPPGPSLRTRKPERPTEPEAVKSTKLKPGSPTPPCCVLTTRGGDIRERRFLSTADELRAEIAGLANHGAPATTTTAGAFVTASSQQARRVESTARPLITLHGLPTPFLSILLDSPLDIDPAFVEAHAVGRSYRPLGARRRRGDGAARYAHWDYPELVTGHWKALACRKGFQGSNDSLASTKYPEDSVDLARELVVRPVSDTDKKLAAVFCRASLWMSKDVDVLFLDKPCWGEKGPLRKARRVGKVKRIYAPSNQERLTDRETKSGSLAMSLGMGQEIPSLESTVQDSLANVNKDGGVFQFLEETAHEHWLELFEVLTPRQKVVILEETSLEWRIMQALERNFDMAKSITRRQNGREVAESIGIRPDDWEGLIQRLRTRIEMLATIPPSASHGKSGTTVKEAMIHEENIAYVPRHRTAAADTPSSSGSDENQRSLDRVTYLGGILLPFSVVSGVLSMNEDFEPGQPLFWVFWVATIPLTLFTVLVIYADKLRQVEVWAEVSDTSGSVSGDAESIGEKMEEIEKGKKRPTSVSSTLKYNRHQQPGTVTYSAGGDVVIDLGSPTAEIQQISVEPPEPYEEDQRTDDDQDEGGSSSDEDTAEEVLPPSTHAVHGHRRAWKKQQLGWGGAAMCMLRGMKPLRVSDGIPGAPREE